MIGSFDDGDTQKVWELRRPKGISAALAKAARRKMQILDAAESINDLRVPPGNRLEKLHPPPRGSTASESTTSTAFASPGRKVAPTTSNPPTTTRKGALMA
ncbi:type II toxin-antitoxin system RelE/ParE family toxin, partial [Mycolicibacterium poriferae]|uniref:type II toxin-antitoxin system RelE/ParE family toxin n=1 Tax=Mycolicibacterium poriferae TaxID=39694 RepID=UPI0024BABB39